MEEPVERSKVEQSATLSQIFSSLEELPKGQRRIAEYILEHPAEVVQGTISDLAHSTQSKSESSIVRFYRTMGFSSFHDFKLTIAQEIASRSFYYSYEDIAPNDAPPAIKRKIFKGAMRTLDTNAQIQDTEMYERAVRMLMEARRVVLLGYAASAAVCYYAHFRFLELGLNCQFSPDPHLNTAILAQPAPGDVFFCVSMSGQTPDICQALPHVKSEGAGIIALTRDPASPLGRLADVAICTVTDETAFIADVMNARIAQMCTVDALFSMLSVAGKEASFERLRRMRRTYRSLREGTSEL